MHAASTPWIDSAILPRQLGASRSHDFRDRAFESPENPYANRVTLFRHQSWCFKWAALGKMLKEGKCIWNGWLVPVERSGDMPQNPRVAFYAPRDWPKMAEGFAGTVFKMRITVDVRELPPNKILQRRLVDRSGDAKHTWPVPLRKEIWSRIFRPKILFGRAPSNGRSCKAAPRTRRNLVSLVLYL